MPTMSTMSCGRQCIPRSSPAWTGWGAWICGTWITTPRWGPGAAGRALTRAGRRRRRAAAGTPGPGATGRTGHGRARQGPRPPSREAAPLPAGWGRAGGGGRRAAGEGSAPRVPSPSAAGTAAAERPASPPTPREARGNARGFLPFTCFLVQSLQRLPWNRSAQTQTKTQVFLLSLLTAERGRECHTFTFLWWEGVRHTAVGRGGTAGPVLFFAKRLPSLVFSLSRFLAVLKTHPHVLLLFQIKNKQTKCYRCVLRIFGVDLPVPLRRLWKEPLCHITDTLDDRQLYSEQEGTYFFRAGVLCTCNLMACKNWGTLLIVQQFFPFQKREEEKPGISWQCFMTRTLFSIIFLSLFVCF